MISTLFGTDALGTATAFFAALMIGAFFGFFLERAGFSSSRKMTGVFYFEDMAVIKVMVTAVLTALLGLSLCIGLGWLRPDQLFYMPTVYGAHIVGGLIFGVGFAVGGWCPGTAAAGLGAGKLDALIFLAGAGLGSILFNELFGIVKPLYTAGDRGVRFIYDTVGISKGAFTFLFTLAAVAVFWACERVEAARGRTPTYLGTSFLKAFSLVLVTVAGALLILPAQTRSTAVTAAVGTAPTSAADPETQLLGMVAAAADHMEPEELADRLMTGEEGLVLVDVRPAAEFATFHIPGAINVLLPDLPQALAPHRNTGIIVLYSNGMTHPAQARDALFRLGFGNAYMLTDGLQGFVERCLKPVSLRSEPVPPAAASRINAWRAFFLAPPRAPAPAADRLQPPASGLPAVVDTQWLAANLARAGLRIVDLRSQPEYNTAHIPGSVCLSMESFRGVVGGVSSMLLPVDVLARHFSLMGIGVDDVVVFVSGEKMQDATLAGMACERLGHRRYGILDGGWAQWQAEKRPMDTALPDIQASVYPVRRDADTFTVDDRTVLSHLNRRDAVVIDVRPTDYFTGKKSDEARPGHMPGAINRPYTEDVVKTDAVTRFKAVPDLAATYAALIPSKDALVIVHCRTGHQASQTFFVLRRLLGYTNVLWYDAGWSEWAARPELPVEQ